MDYGQSLCNHLAASEALEPAHAVLGTLLRTGANFKTALLHNPIQLAAQAVAPLCAGADIDGALAKSKTRAPFRRARPRTLPRTGTPAAYPQGYVLIFRTACAFEPLANTTSTAHHAGRGPMANWSASPRPPRNCLVRPEIILQIKSKFRWQ